MELAMVKFLYCNTAKFITHRHQHRAISTTILWSVWVSW